MRIGSLVKSKWLNYNHLGIVTGNAPPDEGWVHWYVQWLGEDGSIEPHLEDERDLEIICE